MNIFEKYRKLIFNILNNLDSKNILELPEHLNSINVDIPPSKYNCDLSTNVAMVISKINKKSPLDVATIIIQELKKDKNIDQIKIENPGFINIKLNNEFWSLYLHNLNNFQVYILVKSSNQYSPFLRKDVYLR